LNSVGIKDCLEEFARGIRSRSSLEECLRGKVRMRFWDTNERSAELLSSLPTVQFTRGDVDAQLRRFLAKELGARELSDWAAGMRLLDCFDVNEDDPGSSEVWDLMDEIMTPDVWEALTIESVIDLRRRLNAGP
jgi:hypothetical protein